MANIISELLDFLLGIDSPNAKAEDVRAFVNNPTQAASQALGTAVTQAQLTQAASAVVAPAAVQGTSNPVQALQHQVAENHGLTFAPEHVFAPETNTAVPIASGNNVPIASPQAGHDAQQGVGNVDLDFDFSRDINASDGSVVNTGTAGDIDNTNVHGSGNVVGDDNIGANTGDVHAGPGSNVQAGGVGNTQTDGDDILSGGGDVISDNEGPVVKTGDIDTSGGNAAGGAGGHGGILGDGGDGGGAAGGPGGGVVISPVQTTSTNTGGGDVTTVDTDGGDISGGVDASHDDNSANSHNTDNSTHDSHDDNSTNDSHDATVDTHVDVSNDVGIF